MTISSFVDLLAKPPGNSKVFNPWHDYDAVHDTCKESPLIRQANMKTYLKAIHPRIILLGEAPSHHGGKFTGMAFTDPLMFLEPPLSELGLTVTAKSPEREMSGRIVWGEMGSHWKEVMLWNIMPFHPHLEGDRMTNRAPTGKEISEFKYILEALMQLFPPAELVPVGNKATSTLVKLDLKHLGGGIRHPAFGGKKEFCEGFRKVLGLQKSKAATQGVLF
ncbi:MAG: uracil-DNA glycosylase [Verrucomicrobiota bacterium]